MDEHSSEEVVSMEECEHLFGSRCLSEYAASMIDQRTWPIACPNCAAAAGSPSKDRGNAAPNCLSLFFLESEMLTLITLQPSHICFSRT